MGHGGFAENFFVARTQILEHGSFRVGLSGLELTFEPLDAHRVVFQPVVAIAHLFHDGLEGTARLVAVFARKNPEASFGNQLFGNRGGPVARLYLPDAQRCDELTGFVERMLETFVALFFERFETPEDRPAFRSRECPRPGHYY